MKKLLKNIAAAAVLAAFALPLRAATVRYVEIRTTLQPGTTGQGPFVSSGTIKDMHASTVTFDNGAKITQQSTGLATSSMTITNLTVSASTITTLNSTNITGTNITGTNATVTASTITTLNSTTITAVSVNGSTYTAASGATGTPSYTFTGDPNTGISRPAADTIALQTNGAVALNVDSNGAITRPKQPAFLAYLDTTQTDVTGDASSPQIAFNAEVFDQANNYNTSTHIFTAPVTGVYSLSVSAKIDQINADQEYVILTLSTSNHTYQSWFPVFGGTTASMVIPLSVAAADMDAGDTAQCYLEVGSGSKTVDIYGTSTANIRTFFSGFLAN